MEPVLDNLGVVLGGCVIIYAINYGFGVFGSEMDMDFGSTKWKRCLVSGLPTAHLRTVKNNLGFLGWAGNGSCVL